MNLYVVFFLELKHKLELNSKINYKLIKKNILIKKIKYKQKQFDFNFNFHILMQNVEQITKILYIIVLDILDVIDCTVYIKV